MLPIISEPVPQKIHKYLAAVAYENILSEKLCSYADLKLPGMEEKINQTDLWCAHNGSSYAID